MGRLIRITILLCFVLCLCAPLPGQVFYSTNPNYLKSKSEQNNLISAYQVSYPDTSITELANFFPRNFLGNIGLPSPTYLWNYGTAGLGYIFYRPPYELDMVTQHDVKYFRSAGPYANLEGIAGSKNLQIFRMLFTQTYRDKVNITLGFKRYTSKGYYKRQETYTDNFYLSSNYQTRNRRVGYYLSALHNSNKNFENGGLQEVFLNDTTAAQFKDVQQVNISDASRDNRDLKMMVNPYFRLNRRSDSAHVTDHFIQVKSGFNDNRFKYTDANSRADGYYSDFYLDTVSTKDSSHHRQFTNEVAYTLLNRVQNTAISAGIRHEINQVYQVYDDVYQNRLVFGDLGWRLELKNKDSVPRVLFSFDNIVSGQYVIDGINGGNTKVEGRSQITGRSLRNWQLNVSVLFENRSPDQYYKYWVSNHFYWRNNFPAVSQVQYKLGIGYRNKFGLSFLQQNITNYLYFDQFALPAMADGLVSNSQVMLHYNSFDIPHLGFALRGAYQATSRPDIVRVPELSATAKIFYYGQLFRNNLQLQLGFQGQWYQAFKPYDYMPATQAFYIQNEVTTRTYPFVDAYLNARIRPVSFFLKMENILQGFVPPDHYLTPGYYQPDRAFRLGISWMFFD